MNKPNEITSDDLLNSMKNKNTNNSCSSSEGDSNKLLDELFDSLAKLEKHKCYKCDQARDLSDVKYIVIHISGSGYEIDRLVNYFKYGPHSVQVSYLVEGNRVIQITRDGIVPWAIGDHMKPQITNKDIISIMIVSDSKGRIDAKSLNTTEVLVKGLIDLYHLTTDKVVRYSTRGMPCVGDLSSNDRWLKFLDKVNKIPSISEYDPLDLINRMI